MDLLVIMQEAENTPMHRRQITGKLFRCLASLPIPKDILVNTTNEVEKWGKVPGHVIATGINEGNYMAGYDLACELLASAKSDLKALSNILDSEAFDDRVFGFHPQQTVEKRLKAWLNVLQQSHPFTHNLSLLISSLEKLEGSREVEVLDI